MGMIRVVQQCRDRITEEGGVNISFSFKLECMLYLKSLGRN